MMFSKSSFYRPRAITGMASGMFIMTLFGAAWFSWGLAATHISHVWLTTLLACSGLALLVAAISLFRLGRRTARQDGPPNPDQKRALRRMGRWYGIIFAAEFVAIWIAVNFLYHFHGDPYIAPVIALIVGIHFVPLARLFRFPGYYLVAAAIIAVSLLSFDIPCPLRETVVGLGLGAILWFTCAAMIRGGLHLASAKFAALS